MRAPDFWRQDGVAARLLAPLGALYNLAGRLRRHTTTACRAKVPVICIGNLVAGGAGKTPVALSLAGLLQDRGLTPHFLTRGYGGSRPGPLRVDPQLHLAREVGDEALLLAAAAPTWVARDRAAGAQAAVAAGADLIVMDDGFQNPGLEKDLSFLVVDGDYGFGNQRVLPAGPLREAIEPAIARAQALVVLGADRHGLEATFAVRLPVFNASLKPAPAAPDLTGKQILAFAGIGRPEKFFQTLRDMGAEVIETRAFADHHPYSATEIDGLLARAQSLSVSAITTEKDAARLTAIQRDSVVVLPITVTWQDPDAVAALLNGACSRG